MKYYLFNVNSEQYSLSSNYMGQLWVNWQYWRGHYGNNPFCTQFSIPKIALRIWGDILNWKGGPCKLVLWTGVPSRGVAVEEAPPWSTIRRYASFWNAVFFEWYFATPKILIKCLLLKKDPIYFWNFDVLFRTVDPKIGMEYLLALLWCYINWENTTW